MRIFSDDPRNKTLDGQPINPAFGPKRWLDALRRMRERIAAGLELRFFDDDTIGSKDTHCSWGMCSGDKEQWPDHDDHTWPVAHWHNGRVAPRSQQPDQWCPMDRRVKPRGHLGPPEASWGCFYRCRIFTPREKRPDQKRTLQLYDDVIAEYEAKHGATIATADDREPWDR